MRCIGASYHIFAMHFARFSAVKPGQEWARSRAKAQPHVDAGEGADKRSSVRHDL